MIQNDLRNRRVTVVGLGNSGYNAANLLIDVGAKVRATDSGTGEATERHAAKLKSRGACVETGAHTEGFMKDSELIVVSPGVEDSSLPVKWAMSHDIPMIGEMELGYRFCKGKVIGITGTNGKSTVTTLIGDILKAGGKHAIVCGNIGNSLCGEIPRIRHDSWVVLEVSSFQLEKIDSFHPRIAVILNITDDHMDRYRTLREYFSEKEKICINQTPDDYLVLNHDAENLGPIRNRARAKTFLYSRSGNTNGAYLKGGDIICEVSGAPVKILSIPDITLKGVHNIENVLACAVVGTLAGIRADKIKDAVRNFKGLRHRMELVSVVDGVEYIDDSKGTTVDSTKRALESFNNNVILIAGGKDKNSDYSAVRDAIRNRVSHLIVIGEAKGRIRQALGSSVETHDAADMRDAVRMAKTLATNGASVILSPMCSSFDMFRDYKHRGDVFREAVLELEGRHP